MSISRSDIDVDAAQAFFTNYTCLQCLILDDTQIDDRHLQALASASRLQWLSIRNTGITDTGISHLTRCVQLRIIDASGNRITDASLVSMGALPKLAELRLNATDIGDKGMHALVRMAELRRLELRDTRISGASLDELQAIPNLQYLDVSHTRVTERDIEKFRQIRPDVVVVGGDNSLVRP